MSDERRYDDDEVHEIFLRATRIDEAGAALPPGETADSGAGRGMTLSELQEIGAEAGIDPGMVARAAASLATSTPSEAVPTVRTLGVPVSVGRVVDLPARLNDEDWDRLVVRLRDLFNARGDVSREGSLRSWSNGNLQILMEPTRDGYRLRMRSLSGAVQARLTGAIGLAAAMIAVMILALVSETSNLSTLLGLLPVMGGGGAALYFTGMTRARRWIARRDAQFEEIGALAWEMAEARRALEPSQDDD